MKKRRRLPTILRLMRPQPPGDYMCEANNNQYCCQSGTGDSLATVYSSGMWYKHGVSEPWHRCKVKQSPHAIRIERRKGRWYWRIPVRMVIR